jgi:predicted 3-demethylubiquinone-9 3-methyltransferase (glyoxalase superfamily)
MKVNSHKIMPYLWYDKHAEEAARFYCSLFDHSEIISTSSMIVEFQLEGVRFIALNGGPKYKFTEATSFLVLCDDQEEVDHFWNRLTAEGGEEGKCGWCKDRFGLSWQIVPKRFMELSQSGSSTQIQGMMNAMMKMNKMVVHELEAAHAHSA